MISRRLLVLSSATLLLASSVALARDPAAYDAKAFEAAKAAGKPILLEVHADWCPTCKAQAPILGQLTNDPKFKNLVVFRIDFDKQKDLLKTLDVRMQSTLIVYKGGAEVGRTVGDTNADSIAKLLNKSV